VAGIGEQNGIAIGWRSGDRLRADEAAGARTVGDDDLLAEPLAQSVGIKPRQDSMVVPGVSGTTMVIRREG
jgi:hypothetical protein